jgi:hypothetical protein
MIIFAATLRVSRNPVSIYYEYAFPHKALDLQRIFGKVGLGLDNGNFLFRSQTLESPWNFSSCGGGGLEDQIPGLDISLYSAETDFAEKYDRCMT